MTETEETKTILIVEDEPTVLNFISRVLELEGYHILQAKDTDEGLKLVVEKPFDLMILDLRLPGGDGFAILEKMKGDPRLMSIPVIVFTASAGPVKKEQVLRLGVTDYLVKPLSAAKLRKAVARILCPGR